MEVSIRRASEKDYKIIAAIGNVAVEEAHRNSCTAEDMNEFLQKNYNDDAIKEELMNTDNLYHILYYNNEPAGFSKIVLNSIHPNIQQNNTTKLDRIYVLKEYHNLKLGYRLLTFNIQLARENNQSAIWLFTWTGNERAVNFYLKAGFTIIGTHQFKITDNHSNPNHHMSFNIQ